ncbi:MAG: bifunctional adenosylcobinamide kinase/adenosylcobinamide-phosphate guanylyltransferase [Chloroflexi bacterium]|nr:bifunctional adenosylcobinamide kinase/adenosylcobinamide-phosphate guanylyltransferase [Chloroflexota bacterium]
MKDLILVLGGARAGKSGFAQRLAAARSRRGGVLFVATAEAGDDEMSSRIKRHQQSRPQRWVTLEEPRDVVGRLAAVRPAPAVVLLDCLTLWASNLLLSPLPARGKAPTAAALERGQRRVAREVERLLRWYERSDASLVVVSNEVGLGIVPADPLTRAYRDALGNANQRIAEWADRVYLLIAGIPLEIKATGTLL